MPTRARNAFLKKKSFVRCSCADRQADGVARLSHLVFPEEVNAARNAINDAETFTTVLLVTPYFVYVAAKDIASLVAVMEAVEGGYYVTITQ